MRGTLSSCDKLTGDFGNGAGATRIGDRNMLCIYADKMSPSDLRLFQQYRPKADFGSERSKAIEFMR
jgi:hypothetical protein